MISCREKRGVTTVIVGGNEAESSNSKRRRRGESSNSRAQREDEEEQECEQEEEEDDEDEDDDKEEDMIWGSIDRDFLECSICLEPLRPSLMHCLNGHVGCSTCWEKLGNKCSVCNHTAVVRSIALEKLVESCKIPCKYRKMGCEESIPYHKKQEHLDNCPFGPCFCPIPTCPHKVFGGKLYKHFVKDHKFSQVNFPFNCAFTFNLRQSDVYVILLGPKNIPFLLKNIPLEKIGHAISLHHITPLQSDVLELSARTFTGDRKPANEREVESVEMKTKVGFIRDDEMVGLSLVVPFEFAHSGQFEVTVLVRMEE